MTKYVFGLLCILLIVGCKARKNAIIGDKPLDAVMHLDKAKEKKALFNKVAKANLNFTFIKARAKTKIHIKNKSYNVTLHLRMKKDEKIWASATTFGGIEVARALITPDSVILINRFQGTFVKKSIRYLQQFINPNISYQSLQEILMGNTPSALINKQNDLWKTTYGYKLSGQQTGVQYNIWFNANYKTHKIAVSEKEIDDRFTVVYGNFKPVSTTTVPFSVEVSSEKDNNFKIQFLYNTFELQKSLDFPFTVPDRYKQIEL